MERDVKISIRKLYKIFGTEPQHALEHRLNGMGKPKLMEKQRRGPGLADVNSDMRNGDITTIMGLPGAGKSTRIRHINRLFEPTSSTVLVDGDTVLDCSENGLRRMRREPMSMVFRHFALLPHRTALEDAGMAPAVRGMAKSVFESAAHKGLDGVGLAGQGDQYPHQLSGGTQQRGASPGRGSRARRSAPSCGTCFWSCRKSCTRPWCSSVATWTRR